jgi:hypothetical protein
VVAHQTKSIVLDRLGQEVEPRLNDILIAARALTQGDTPEPQRQSNLLKIRQSGEAMLTVLNELSNLSSPTSDMADPATAPAAHFGQRVA